MTPILLALSLHLAATDEPPSPLALDDLTVSSTFREDTLLRELAASGSVLDRQELEDAGQQHFADVFHRLPNLNWSSATNRPRFLQIRGIGERSQYEGAPNPSVGFLIDDIDFSGIGTVATLFDVDRVEVLRGPQGTRYGANALAGLVYLRTAAPSRTPGQLLEAQAGDEGTWALGYAATGPVGEHAAYRFSVHQYRNDGFRYNDHFDSDDTHHRDEFSARAKFRWDAGRNWRFDTTLLAADIDNGFDAFAPENTYTVHSDQPGRDAQESLGAAVRATWSGLEVADLVSISSVADSDILYSFDGDWGNPEYWGEFSPYDFTSETRRDRRSLNQELRLVSRPGGTLEWVAGLYLLDLDEDNRFEDLFNGDLFRRLESRYQATSLALFGQVDRRIGDRDTLAAGLRVERRKADYRDTAGLDLEPADTMVGGQLSWRRDFDERRSGYLTLARGYKAGGFNLGLSIPEPRRQFEPESLWNLEAGLKGRFADDRLDARLAVFYARREDMQVQTSFQLDPTDPLTFVFFTDNAATGRNLGVEAEWLYQLDANWQLSGSLGLLDTEFVDFTSPERELDGRDQAHAPSYQLGLAATWRSPRGWFARADLFAQDDFYFSDSHDERARGYELVHLKVGYEATDWAVYGWVRNAFDREYETRGFYFGLEPPEYPDRRYVQLGQPRHIGLTARISFQ